MKPLPVLLLISLFAVLLTALPCAHAASLPFSATGQVLDRNGEPVPGATVTLWDDAYKVIGTATTDASGNFSFTSVKASDSSSCKVTISFTDGGKVYKTDFQDMIWYPLDSGIVKFDTKYTTLTSYPTPEYGYIWGVMQADGANQRALGNGVVYVSTGDRTYYTFTDNTRNKGTFIVRAPVRHYRLWGQYLENGLIFQSGIIVDLDVAGSTNYLDVNSITVTIPLSAAAQNPLPANTPTRDQQNTVSGYVTYNDGRGVPDQPVKLYQAKDSGNGYLVKGEVRTDDRGYFCFSNVQVTADAPDNGVVYGSKAFSLVVPFTDPEGITTTMARNFTLYNPNFFTSDPAADDLARNPGVNFTVPYMTKGWVKISSDTPGARLYIDNRLVSDSEGRPVPLPYTAYLDPGRHMIRVSASGYSDVTIPVDIRANTQTEDAFVHLDKAELPPWAALAGVAILAVAAFAVMVVLIIAVLAFIKR